mgnify:CR=1 FL=1
MNSRKELDNLFTKIIVANLETIDNEEAVKIINTYKELNDKCDKVISKIKERKSKK